MKRRKDFKDIINANAGLSYDHYWRLVALASCDFCFTIPITLRTIILNSLFGAYPWVSWAATHRGYSRVGHISRIALEQEPLLLYTYEINRWAAASCAYLFFGFFGFAKEARGNYRRMASAIAKLLGFTMFTETMPRPGPCIIDHSLHFAPPTSITQQTASGNDSDSLSEKLSTTASKLDLEVQP
jgi:pheromone a factor receptor